MKKNFQYIIAALVIILLVGCSTTTNQNSSNITNTSELENTVELQQLMDELGKQNFDQLPSEDKLPLTTADATETSEATDTNITENQATNTQTSPDEYDYVLIFPSDSYPETALHIYGAIENGHSDVCTIDRAGADENRKQSLAGIDTMEGYDRDEWPMAMCEEGGKGASVAYINPSDNRGAGSWVGHQLSAYEDGEKVLFIVEKPKQLFGNQSNEDLNIDEDIQTDVVYNSCKEAHEAGVTPLRKGDPGYSTKLDRDKDGIACET